MSNDRDDDHILSPEPRSGRVAQNNAEFYRRFNASNIDLVSPTDAADEARKENDSDVSSTYTDEDGPTSSHIAGRKRVYTLSKDYTQEEEKIVIKKFDRKLVLFLSFLYLLSFLDRSNIGNARIAGLEEALNLSDVQFDYCLVAFYLTYITFEWMILLYRVLPAHVYITLCVLGWGVVASLQSVVTSFGQLLALRACLGITEAAFGPGVPFYMTFFYRRSELAYRVGLQISAAPLATSFASSLAWVIVKLSQGTSIEPWRALFLFEGLPSIITALFAWFLIPDSPETARYLNPRERKVARLRLQEESQHDDPSRAGEKTAADRVSFVSRLKNSATVRTLSTLIPWLQALIFLSINVSFASLPVFLPTVINSMSFSAVTSQILSAPPYLLSFAFVLFIGRISDSIPNSRGFCLMACSGLSATSYFIIALFGRLESSNIISERPSIIVRYIAVYGAALGLFSSVVLIITWNLNNQPSKKERGLAMMVMNIVGQCGPLIGVNLFPRSDGPRYVRGMIISGFFMSGVVVLSALLRWKLIIMNRTQGRKKTGYEMVSLSSNVETAQVDGEDEEEEGLMEGSGAGSRKEQREYTFEYML